MFDDIKAKLNTVSPTMCLAKWTQSTINLANGETHSCHHPGRHKIPADMVKENPKVLHNTPIKIFARRELLDGIQTSECDYCWRIENTNKTNASDRLLKSHTDWSAPLFDSIVASGLGEEFSPTYLEIMFENTCNFACVYCQPDISSRVMEDIESNGPYELPNQTLHDIEFIKKIGKYPIHRNDFNPYIEAFWKWWPELFSTLHTLRITGGEPLLSKQTWKLFDWIKERPNNNLEFAINTNLCVPDKLITLLIENLKSISGNVKKISLYTSFEATGKSAEFIRFGLNYDVFISNLKLISKELPNIEVVIMTTHNLLCAPTFLDFFETVIKLRNEYFRGDKFKFVMSINYLRNPTFLDLRILPRSIKNKLSEDFKTFIYKNQNSFNNFEIDQLERLVKYMNLEDKEQDSKRKDLKEFLKETSRRKGIDYSKTFAGTSLLEWVESI